MTARPRPRPKKTPRPNPKRVPTKVVKKTPKLGQVKIIKKGVGKDDGPGRIVIPSMENNQPGKSRTRGIDHKRNTYFGKPADKQYQWHDAENIFKAWNPLPEAAAYQAPLAKAWTSGVKVVLKDGKKTTVPWRKAHVKHQKTTAVTKHVAGGKTTSIGQPQSKNYLDVVGGEAFERKQPNVAMTTDKSGQFVPDIPAAGEWWQNYIKIPIVGVAEKGGGQPKGIDAGRIMGMPVVGSKFQTVQAGPGKTRTFIHQSTRLEAGQTKGAPDARIKAITAGVAPRTKIKTGKTSKKLLNLNKEWAKIGDVARTKALKAQGATTEINVIKYGFNSLSDAQKKVLLTKAGYKFD